MRHKENHRYRHVSMYRTTGVWALVLALVLLGMADSTSAQPVDIPATWGGRLLVPPPAHRQLGGLRDELGKHGVVLDVDLLQTLQGVASGGRNDVATYWGTAEYTLNVDTQKLGLWPGGFLRVQGLSSFGQNINHASGALISPSRLARGGAASSDRHSPAGHTPAGL